MVWSRTTIRNPAQRMISDSQRELVGWTGGARRRFDIIPLPFLPYPSFKSGQPLPGASLRCREVGLPVPPVALPCPRRGARIHTRLVRFFHCSNILEKRKDNG